MYCVYILANWNNQVLYTGISSDLKRRLYEHRNSDTSSFAGRYAVNRLVYYEITNDVKTAIAREKQIKAYRRDKKNRLVEKLNPRWEDLSNKL